MLNEAGTHVKKNDSPASAVERAFRSAWTRFTRDTLEAPDWEAHLTDEDRKWGRFPPDYVYSAHHPPRPLPATFGDSDLALMG